MTFKQKYFPACLPPAGQRCSYVRKQPPGATSMLLNRFFSSRPSFQRKLIWIERHDGPMRPITKEVSISNQTQAGLWQRNSDEINSASSLLFTISQIIIVWNGGILKLTPGMEIDTSRGRWLSWCIRIRGAGCRYQSASNWPPISFLPSHLHLFCFPFDINPTRLTAYFHNAL